MGGARSEVEPGTTRVLLEVATWNGPNIHRTSWALGLRSEASGRFEKGLQPEQTLARAGARERADRRALRRPAAAGHDRRRRRGAAAAEDRAARAARRGDPRPAGGGRAPSGDPGGARLRDRARRGRSHGHGAGVAPRRRHARDRPDRGGRADRRARAPARDAPRAPWRRGAADPSPARAARRRGRDGRPRPVRGHRLELHRPGAARPAAPARRTPAARRRDGREPALGGPLDHAPDAARLAARRRPAQPRARRERDRHLRVGHGLPLGARTDGGGRAPCARHAAERLRWRHVRGAANVRRPTSSRPRRCWKACSTGCT